MLDALKPLLESGLVNEETRQAIQEAWAGKLQEARDEIRTELREEFAQRYDHDKTVMVEALDQMVTDKLMEEIQQVQAEKLALAEDRVKFQSKMRESSSKFNNFMVSKLAEELGELRKDRKQQTESVSKLETFVMHALAREISEFAKDKREVTESKVRLVAEARKQLTTLKSRFVKESSVKLSKSVAQHLKSELNQLQEDIKIARENSFGRRIFEAFATEFGVTHLNEKAEIRKMHNALEQKAAELAEAKKVAAKATMLVEAKNREVKMITESNDRQKTMEELLGPLNREKAQIMRDLLENVQTTRLKSAYEKYLPAVLAEGFVANDRKTITETRGKVVTGDKSAQVVDDRGSLNNIIEIKRLAGLK